MTTSTFKCIIYIILIQICLTHPVNKIVTSPSSSINCIYNNNTNTIIECYITNNTNFTNIINNSTNHNTTIIDDNDDKLEAKHIQFFVILGCSLFIFLAIMCYIDNNQNIDCKPLTKI
jgi:hypothetical protein